MIPPFTPEQLAQLRTAQPTDSAMQRRLEALQLVSQGYQVRVVAQRSQVAPKTIYKWLHAFQRFGVRGIQDHWQEHGLRRIDDRYLGCLEETLAVPKRKWPLNALSEHLYWQTDCRISPQRLSRLLKSLGYAYCRVECWIEAQLVFSGSTWVKAAPGRNRSEAPIVYAVDATGCVSSTAKQENMTDDP